MRLIDADELKAVYIPSEIEGFEKMMVPVEVVLQNIDDMPTVDAVPVVRCGECRYWDRYPSCSATPQYHACRRRIMGNVHTMREDFCSQGERKDGERHDRR